MIPRNDVRLIAAGAALLAAVLVFGVTLVRAFTGPELDARTPAPLSGPPAASQAGEALIAAPNAEQPGTPARVPPAPEGVAAAALAAIELAADHDPFQPDRRRAPTYGSAVEAPRVEREPPPPPPAFNVIGVVAAPSGGLAMIQVEAGTPQLVSIGESIDGYELVAVDEDGAVLEGQAGRLVYEVDTPVVPQPRNNRNNRNNRGGNGNDDERRAGPAAVMPVPIAPAGAASLSPEQIQRLREAVLAGAPPEQVRALMQNLQGVEQQLVPIFNVRVQDGQPGSQPRPGAPVPPPAPAR